MELREVAERILFAETLEEKLIRPRGVVDNHPGNAIITPSKPIRPPGLSMQDCDKVPFPGIHKIESNEDRGILMHFLANHELLALEFTVTSFR